MPARTPEGIVKQQIQKYLTTVKNVILVSNPSGVGYVGKLLKHTGTQVILGWARRISFGCFSPGAPDLIGFRTITIRPEDVGSKIAQFVALEIKRESGGRATPEQIDLINMVRERGGLSAIISNISQAQELFGEPDGESS